MSQSELIISIAPSKVFTGGFQISLDASINKSGLQPVSRPVEQVHYIFPLYICAQGRIHVNQNGAPSLVTSEVKVSSQHLHCLIRKIDLEGGLEKNPIDGTSYIFIYVFVLFVKRQRSLSHNNAI